MIDVNSLKSFRDFFVSEQNKILNLHPEEIDVDGDEVDLAQGDVIEKVESKLAERARMRLKAIDRAIEKIDSGDFGICDECGDDISIGRLKAAPETALCIVCAEKKEKK